MLSDKRWRCGGVCGVFPLRQLHKAATYQYASMSNEHCSNTRSFPSRKSDHHKNTDLIRNSSMFENKLLRYNSSLWGSTELNLGEALTSYLKSDDTEKSTQNEYLRIIDRCEFLSITKTNQKLSDLVLPEREMDLIRGLIEALKNPQHNYLTEWGLMTASLCDQSSQLAGKNILLHGHAGTGKTFVAGVIANEVGRDLISINAGLIRDKFYGNTEKNALELFSKMNRIISLAKESPIFLLNEGDQIIHQRKTTLEGSTDHSENALQSIFLEEMEKFAGILIVTTNLLCNLDIAMSRRFHYKIEFKAPDTDCRLQLWKKHLPDSIPGATNIDLQYLAHRYAFTGGQIRIVVQNACQHAISRGKDPILLQSDILYFADLEVAGSYEAVQKNRIGFVA